jgi:outer membrane immunogenic protein
MRFNKTALLVALIALPILASAQLRPEPSFGTDPGQTAPAELTAGYIFGHANAPPGQCGCFALNGGFGSLVINAPHGISIVADLAAMHAPHVSGTAQSITVFNYLFGPRYSLRTVSKRFTPYVQVLGGGSEEISNYIFAQNVNGAAFSGGAGVSTILKNHIGWNIAEADWVYSKIPNAQNNHQSYLRVGSAISFRFGPR